MDKTTVRKQLKARLSTLCEEEKAKKSQAIAERVLHSPEYSRAHSLFLFLSTPDEPDTRPLIAKALADGKKVYLPRITEQDMFLVPYDLTTPLTPNRYGIFEPEGEGESVTPDLALIPLLGFDREKHRLGRGKGYYDRFLCSYRGTSFALAFSEQEWEKVPVQEFDRNPDAVITDKEMII